MSHPAHNADAAVQLLYELTAIVREETGLSEVLAGPFADAITRGLRKRLGGQQIYIPTEDRASRAVRDAAIRRAFTGRNLAQVCRKYNISLRQGYRITHVRPSSTPTTGE